MIRFAFLAFVLLASTAPAAQEVAGRLGVRSQWDLGGPLRLRAEQQVQTTLVTPGDSEAFGGIDVVFDDDVDDDGPDSPDDPDDDDLTRGVGSAKAADEVGTPTTFLTDWASRTEIGLTYRVSRAVRAATELGVVLCDGGPVLSGSVGLSTSHPLTDALDVGTSVLYEVQQRGGKADSRVRLGTSLERDLGRFTPSVGVELFADPSARRFRRARLDVGSAFRLSGGQRVGAELRFQRRIDRADGWDAGARLTYRLDL